MQQVRLRFLLENPYSRSPFTEASRQRFLRDPRFPADLEELFAHDGARGDEVFHSYHRQLVRHDEIERRLNDYVEDARQHAAIDDLVYIEQLLLPGLDEFIGQANERDHAVIVHALDQIVRVLQRVLDFETAPDGDLILFDYLRHWCTILGGLAAYNEDDDEYYDDEED